MSRIRQVRIRCITPVHVGNGHQPALHVDYLVFAREGLVAILDDLKVLEIIGREQVPIWIRCIEERASLLDYLKKRKPDLRASDVAKRVIPMADSGLEQAASFREFIRDARGMPYLPGSSLKGAIRSSLMAKALSIRYPDQEERIPGNLLFGPDRKPTANKLEEMLFGSNPNQDVFRLLKLTDAHFQETALYRVSIYSLTHGGWKEKRGNRGYAECIPEGSIAKTHIRLDNSELTTRQLPCWKTTKSIFNFDALFGEINKNTRNLLDDEIQYWEEDTKYLPPPGYLQQLRMAREMIDDQGDQAALLRCGYGTGWYDKAGIWADAFLDDQAHEAVVRTVQSGKRYPEDFPVPKTRKLSGNGLPFGFISLERT